MRVFRLHEQVMIGRGDVDTTLEHRLAIAGMNRLQPATAAENSGEDTRAVRGNVEDDENSGGNIFRQAFNQLGEGFDAARRRSNHDQVVSGQPDLPLSGATMVRYITLHLEF